MSHQLNVRTINIEADSLDEAVEELRAKLQSTDVPADVIEAVVARLKQEHGSDDTSTDEAELPTSTNASRNGRVRSEARGDLRSRADAIASLPPEERAKAMEETVVELGKKFGYTREEALSKANRAMESVNSMLATLGIQKPEGFPEAFEVSAPETAAPETDVEEIRKQVSYDFDAAIKKLYACGYSQDVVSHIGWFHNVQDSISTFYAMLFTAATALNHVPSAKLWQSLDDYIRCSNEFVYGVLKNADVNPDALGFIEEAEWRAGFFGDKVTKYRQRVQNVLDSSN